MALKVTPTIALPAEMAPLSATDLLADPGDDGIYDLLGIGFGPASLAIAIAIYDILDQRALVCSTTFVPKIKFLERQDTFRWHSGMLLPGTKMQISFVKDLATVRNPQSHFTFLNYLKEHNRLIQFTNLDTFLPLRIEFEDYLRWCAYHFDDTVEYSQDVISVKPIRTNGHKKFDCLEIVSRDNVTGVTSVQRGRNVVVAVGGRPSIPAVFPQNHSNIIHSSRYNHRIGEVLPDKEGKYTIAVLGGGQSAAEIFNDLQTRYPNSNTRLLMRDTALRPSDDSPFVNEVFNPEAVDEFYSTEPVQRAAQLKVNKATNYSVVRLGLLEQLYQQQYEQRLQNDNPDNWQHRILPSREVTSCESITSSGGHEQLRLTTKSPAGTSTEEGGALIETHTVDAVVYATGYIRDVHNQILAECLSINGSEDGKTWQAERDYKVQLNRDLVEDNVQIYLQGCNEKTHGLSDTLLSILATRGGELVDSVFAQSIAEADKRDIASRRKRDGRITGSSWRLYPEEGVKGGKVNGVAATTKQLDAVAI